MAKYDAQINLLISGQRELDRLADRLRSIERQIVDINRLGVSPQQRDPVTGRFGADPDRQNRVRLAGIQRIAKEEERRSRLTSARLREQNAELERSILLQSRLNSAVSLYETELEKLSRGGGGAKLSESLREQVKDIQAAYDAATAGGTKNLSIVKSLGTELGRIVERQNEINRLSSFQSKAFFDTQKFERRIFELRRAGAAASEFGGVGRQIRELRSAQAKGSEFEAKDVSRRIKESLDRIARELQETTRQARIENSARIAARSWTKFFEDANINARRLEQNQKDATAKFRSFFEDAAIQAFEINQNAKDTRRAWQNFFEDAQKEADRLRGERLSGFARRRGRSDQYGIEAGPLPAGTPGAPRYFQEAKQFADQLFDVESEIGKIRQESLSESLRLETERLSLAEKRRKKESEIRDVLLEAITFGKGSQVKRAASDIAVGSRNALVRGGLGLGALGLGGAYAATQQAIGNVDLGILQGPATQAATAIGGAINSALGGVPGLIADMLSALGNIPGSLGLASVAALAFAPAMKTAGEAVFLAGKKFGESKFGENIKLTLDRQTNLFESVINKASEMNMVLDASRSGLDAVGRKIEALPALPAAGQTAFRGELRRGRGGAFLGGGAREITNPEFLATAAGTMAQRTQEAAQTSLMFAEGLGQAADEAKTIAGYLKQANELRAQGESTTQRFIRQTVERGRVVQQNQASAEAARQRSAFLTGGQYSLAQVPARGELFPGGRTTTAQPAYREMLNTAAKVAQLQRDILEAMSKQQGFAATIGQLERRTINDKSRSLQIQQEENAELQRSIQIIRERNKELRQRPISAMTPRERVSAGVFDPATLQADRRRRIAEGRARQESVRRATSEGLIGGAFPLLFGQGLGATVGGGLGGALGGFAGGGLGFGLSLAGTAIGTAFDTATESAKSFVVALEDTGDATSALETAFGRIDKETKTLISNLAESGQRAAAAEASFEALAQKVGTDQAEAFQRAGEAARNWGAGVQTQLTKLYANAVLLAETIARIFPQQQASVFDFVEAKPEQPITQEAQNRLEDLLGQNNLLEKQVVLSRLTADASVDQRLQLERQVALQDYVNDATDLERQLKQNLLSQQEYNLRLKGAELNLTKQVYDLENAAAQERENRARQARQEAERAAKEQERAIASVLGLQSELMQVGLAGADIDIENARIRAGDIGAIEEELNQLQQRFNYEARILDLQLQQKLTSSDISAQEKTLLESIYRQQLGNLEAQYNVRQATLQQASAQLQLDKFIAAEEAKRQAIDPFVQFRQSQQFDQQYAQTYLRLLTEGIAPAEARRLAEFERLVNQQLKSLDIQVAIAQSTYDQAVALGVVGQELKNYADNLERVKGVRAAAATNAALGAGPATQELPGMKIQEFISNAQQELQDLESVAIRVSQGIGDALGNSIADGVNSMIDGTKTAQEVFADLLKNIANILLQESTRMIATYIAIGIARMFAFGGGSQVGKNFEMPSEAFILNGGFKFPGAASGAYFANGITAFANGGTFTNSVVSSPTLFKFADGGVTRMGVMGETSPEAIMPLKRGPGGRLGVDASGSGGDNITVTVNVDAKGSSVQGDDQRGNQLGRAISAAVQQELIKQKRPRGLLA